MTLRLITAPAAEPITLAQAKAHLRVDHADDDAMIEAIIQAARQRAEHETGRTLTTQTWERVLDAFPAAEIELGVPPVRSVVSVTYADPSGATQVMDSDLYVLDAIREPGWLLPVSAWPSTAQTVNAVRIRFIAGFGDGGDVPAAIRQWMLLHIGGMYDNRSSTVVAPGVVAAELPNQFLNGLLDPFRVYQ